MQERVIGGALSFLAAVGEDIRESIPNKALHDGDIIQIQHEVQFFKMFAIFNQSQACWLFSFCDVVHDKRSLLKLAMRAFLQRNYIECSPCCKSGVLYNRRLEHASCVPQEQELLQITQDLRRNKIIVPGESSPRKSLSKLSQEIWSGMVHQGAKKQVGLLTKTG